MDSFYGQILRNNFPQLSRVRRDDGSVGGGILDKIGNEIEDSRKNLFSSSVRVVSSSHTPEATKSFLYKYQINNSDYLFEKNRSAIKEVNCSENDFVEAISEFDIYSEKPNFIKAVSSKNYTVASRIIVELDNMYYEEDPLVLNKFKGSRVYINIQEFEEINQNINQDMIYVCLRGFDKNLKPLEEYIPVHDIGMYVSKNKFRSIENISKDINKEIIGGCGIEFSGVKKVKAELLTIPVQSWEETKKTFYSSLDTIASKTIEKKRIKINNVLSSVFLEKSFQNIGALTDNELFLEVFKTESETYLRYIHSYVFHAQDYKSEENMVGVVKDDDFFFETEEIILEQELVDENNESIVISDFTYDEISNSLITIESSGKINMYELGKTPVKSLDFEETKLRKTRNKELRLEATQQRILKNSFNYFKVLCHNNVRPIKNFFIGRYKPSASSNINDIEFYDNSQNAWEKFITLAEGLYGVLDDLDSINIFNFEDILEESGQYCYYLFSYHESKLIKPLIDAYNFRALFNNEQSGFEEIAKIFYSDHNNYFVEELKIFVEENTPIKVFNEYENPVNDFDGIFTDNQSNKLYISQGNSIECLELYNKVWFLKDDAIYSTEKFSEGTTFSVVFENNESVDVSV